MHSLSVIICSHNSRSDYLRRTLKALEEQSLDATLWELIIVDNASEPSVEQNFAVDLPDFARVIVEPEKGLTPARIRGIHEARGDLIVFVDDDNLLEPDYLEEALRLAESNREIGVFGGSSFGEFESFLPTWMRPHLGVLAVREVDRPLVGSDLKSMHGVPFGAGMVVRGKVAAAYLEKLEREPIRRHLDRCGKNFLGGGDRDLARTARQLDLKWAVYPTLRLTHLISKDRLDPDYFKRLWQGGMAATAILNRLDGVEADSGRRTRGSGLRGAYRALRFWKRRRMVRRLRAESKVIVKRFFETHRELLERPFTHESSRSRDS